MYALSLPLATGLFPASMGAILAVRSSSCRELTETWSAGPNGAAAADLNGDGVKDIVVINIPTGQVTTVLSQKLRPTLAVTPTRSSAIPRVEEVDAARI